MTAGLACVAWGISPPYADAAAALTAGLVAHARRVLVGPRLVMTLALDGAELVVMVLAPRGRCVGVLDPRTHPAVARIADDADHYRVPAGPVVWASAGVPVEALAA
ncbi:hypothetical protein [Streptomyces sp. NPDC048606]|uniref:hypothetical protein n=1 Tax=Streptomyces sp. NPDC048606 TaxID=3154726 RepID=UPI003434A445